MTARRVAVVLSLFLLAPAAAPAADCPVAYPHPAKAGKITASLVQAFWECGGQFGTPPNTTTEDGVDACYPAATFHELGGSLPDGWRWGAKAKGSVAIKARRNQLLPPAHPLNLDPGAVDLEIRVSLSDVRDQHGVATLTEGTLAAVLRATVVDRGSGAVMTLPDFPMSLPLPVLGGKVKAAGSLTAYLNSIDVPALPACTSIELMALDVKDPNGVSFARIGTYLP